MIILFPRVSFKYDATATFAYIYIMESKVF